MANYTVIDENGVVKYLMTCEPDQLQYKDLNNYKVIEGRYHPTEFSFVNGNPVRRPDVEIAALQAKAYRGG